MPFGHIKKNQRNDKVTRYAGRYSTLNTTIIWSLLCFDRHISYEKSSRGIF